MKSWDNLGRLLFASFISAISCLEMELYADKSFTVAVGDDAVLVCAMKFGNSELYTLKWFKDGLEFLRCIPKDETPIHLYHTPGVYLHPVVTSVLHQDNCTDLVHSLANIRESRIKLLNVSRQSDGVYSCEVSEESPIFRTKSMSKRLEVYELPKKQPKIEGVKIAYRLGTLMKVSCSSSPSYPAANVSWAINGVKLTDKYVTGYETKQESGDRRSVSTSRLTYRISEMSFDVQGLMILQCAATIEGFYNSSSQEDVYLDLTVSRGYRHDAEDDSNKLNTYTEDKKKKDQSVVNSSQYKSSSHPKASNSIGLNVMVIATAALYIMT